MKIHCVIDRSTIRRWNSTKILDIIDYVKKKKHLSERKKVQENQGVSLNGTSARSNFEQRTETEAFKNGEEASGPVPWQIDRLDD